MSFEVYTADSIADVGTPFYIRVEIPFADPNKQRIEWYLIVRTKWDTVFLQVGEPINFNSTSNTDDLGNVVKLPDTWKRQEPQQLPEAAFEEYRRSLAADDPKKLAEVSYIAINKTTNLNKLASMLFAGVGREELEAIKVKHTKCSVFQQALLRVLTVNQPFKRNTESPYPPIDDDFSSI